MQQTSVQKQYKNKEVLGGIFMITAIKKRINNEKGLTLVELLAVIVILAIVAAIAIPSIGNIIENSRYNAAKADAMNVLSAANLYFVAEPNSTSITVSDLLTGGYLDTAGKVPTTATITKKPGGNTISTTLTYSGTKTVVLINATIALINADPQKGSSGTINNIGS